MTGCRFHLVGGTSRQTRNLFAFFWVVCVVVTWRAQALAQGTNLVVDLAPPEAASLPDLGESVLRVIGALILVIGLFLAGVWAFRNWQRLTIHKRGAPRLRVLETRSLGHRNMLYLVGFEQHRLLLAASPGGVNLISQLPDETAAVPAPVSREGQEPFRHALNEAMDATHP